jgi:hypothetical protein
MLARAARQELSVNASEDYFARPGDQTRIAGTIRADPVLSNAATAAARCSASQSAAARLVAPTGSHLTMDKPAREHRMIALDAGAS